MRLLTLLTFVFALLCYSGGYAAEPNLAQLEQQALRSAADAVADSVVQIRTIGGLDRIGKTAISKGPTTGLIISEEGYIVSSAFNFAGKPNSILVRLATGQQVAAELIARDNSRMLVLLKVEASTPLPVPTPSEIENLQVGQWAVALGRTFQAEEVGVSVGIVSALNRMYGRVVQTDANVSVANYGGPLVDVSGRVIGVLVPMAPSATGGEEQAELAGANFYDSGIGFAVPLQHVLTMLERWKQGDDLLPGKLGIGMVSGDAHIMPPEITSVWPNSPAADAGWKAEDRIVAVENVKVATQSQLRFQIVPHYAGDTVSITLRRGKEDIQTRVTLAGKLAPYQHAFLGILPSRKAKSEEISGLTIRGVWPKSPAAVVGIQAGDRLLKIQDAKTEDSETTWKALQASHPTQEVNVTIIRDGKQETLTATLTTLPEEILSEADLLPMLEPVGDRSADDKESKDVAFALELLEILQFPRSAKYYLPKNRENESVGMLLWLTEADDASLAELAEAWQAWSQRDHLALVFARPQDEKAGWRAEDLGYLKQLAAAAKQKLSVDGRRIVIGGQGKAGQTALALAFKQRNFYSGVVAVDAPLPRTLKLPKNSPASRLSALMVETQNASFAPLIRRDLKQLREASYPTSWMQSESNSKQVSNATRNTIARWIDSLDRL